MHMGTRFTTEPAVSLGTEILFAFLQASVLRLHFFSAGPITARSSVWL